MDKNILKYKDYLGSIEYSEKDKCLHGKILGIDDLVTFEGESVSQLKQEFQDAVEEYLDICKRHLREPQKSQCRA